MKKKQELESQEDILDVQVDWSQADLPDGFEKLHFDEKIPVFILNGLEPLIHLGIERNVLKKLEDILLGRLSGFNLENGLHKHPCFGRLREFTPQEHTYFIHELISQGLVLPREEPYQIFGLTPAGRRVSKIRKKARVSLHRHLTSMDIPDFDMGLYSYLKEVRKTQSKDEGIPAYRVAPNRTLLELSALSPKKLDELDRIYGIGESRKNAYGEMFIKAIKNYHRQDRKAKA